MAWLFFRLIYLPGSESPFPPNQSTCSLGDLCSPFWPPCWQSGLLLWFLCTCDLTSHLPKPTNAKSTYSAPNPKVLPEENHTALQNCIASIHGLHPGLGLLSLDSSLSRTSQQPKPSRVSSAPYSPLHSADNLAFLFQKTEGICHDYFQIPISPHNPSLPITNSPISTLIHLSPPVSRVKFPPCPRTSLDPIHPFIHPFNLQIITKGLLCDRYGSRLVNKTGKLRKLTF